MDEEVIKNPYEWPRCHNTEMGEDWADDGPEQVSFYICKHCGHTIEQDRWLTG